MNNGINSPKKARMEFSARITMSDGTIVERTIEVPGGIPDAEEMDFSSVEAVQRSFDAYERPVVEARNKICDEITKGYADELAKKSPCRMRARRGKAHHRH